MKKVLFAGALAACMALSSAAFAAENFGTTGITGTYDKQAGTVSVTTIPETLTTGADQLTLVILNGASADNASIVKEKIMYIDQDSVTNETKFTGMGLLNGLEDGTYTLRMGSDNSAAIAEVEFTVTSGTTPGTKEIKFIYGDINGSGLADETDATDILLFVAGADATRGDATIALNTELVDANNNNTIIFGDINGSGLADETDATDILLFVAGADATRGDATIALNTEVTMNVANTVK